MQKLHNLWKWLQYQNPYAKILLVLFWAPWLILALFILPSPMTAMKAEVYSVIIPLGIGGTLISILMEVGYRRRLHRRRMDVVVWPKSQHH